MKSTVSAEWLVFYQADGLKTAWKHYVGLENPSICKIFNISGKQILQDNSGYSPVIQGKQEIVNPTMQICLWISIKNQPDIAPCESSNLLVFGFSLIKWKFSAFADAAHIFIFLYQGVLSCTDNSIVLMLLILLPKLPAMMLPNHTS